MLGVNNVSLQGDYTVFIELNNGQSGIINFKEELEKDHRPIIRELLDIEIFKTVKIYFHTLCWDNGVDFAPEYLFDLINIQKIAA